MSKSAPKKPKTADESDDFEAVKRYLLECPHVNKNSPAIKAALEGIEREEKRRERDAKLHRKFAKETSLATGSPSASASINSNLSDSLVVVDKGSPPPLNSDSDEMMGWQDVAAKKDDDDDGADGISFLGKQLSRVVIDSISENNIKVKSPVAAIAVVFHASLRSDLLGFSCTGVPEDPSAKKGGFAAPVRELPKSQFLPANWDSKPEKVALRYRKDGTGALVLVVLEEAERKVHVKLQPASSKEPPAQSLEFALEEHVNLDSWNAALKVSSSISPALHYKSLAVLLTKFCQTFDLGAVDEAEETAAASPYVDNTAQFHAEPHILKSGFVSPQPVPGITSHRPQQWKQGVPTTIDQAFPNPRLPRGDFGDDLAPAGLRDPRFADPPGRVGGNLMGPNHPMFQGGGIHGPPLGGPGSMQPRFDPFYPPGVDPDMEGNPRRNQKHRSGEPNPDHLRPPNSFGHDMFS